MLNAELRFNSLHPQKPLSLPTHLHPLTLHPFIGRVVWNTVHPLWSMTISCDIAADFFSDFGCVNFFFLLLPYRNMTLQVGPMEETERWIRRRGCCVVSCSKCIGDFTQGSFHGNLFHVKFCAKLEFTYNEDWLTSNGLITI